MFGLLLILAPFAGLLPFSALLSSSTQTLVTTIDTKTLNYNVVSTETYFGSTSGFTTIQSPLVLAPRGIGFIAPKGKCAQFSLPVSVISGTTLNVAMTSSKPANLYLLPTYTFQLSLDGCGIIGNTILAENNFTSYRLHWTAPENGTFYLIFTGPTTIIILMDRGSTKPVQQIANITYAASTETTSWIDTSTSATTYTITTPVTSPLYLQSAGKYSLPIEVNLLILTITSGALVLQRKRKT